MAAERQKLQAVLCRYISDTLAYFAKVREFYEGSSDWICGMERELNLVMDIGERAEKIDLNLRHVVESKNKGKAIAEYVKSKVNVDGKQEELEKELASLLKETLEGLEKLNCFLDALEKLAVTSLYVFMESQVLHLPKGINLDDVQVAIITARHVCPLLLDFKRDTNAFFVPKLQNVGVLSYQLDKYIQTTQNICRKLEKSSLSEFEPKMTVKTVVDLDAAWSEDDVQRMLYRTIQLDKIRMNQNFRMVFLFQEEPCAGFISEFNERKPKMLQFLEELEENAVQLDRMSKGAKISSVAGSSVGVVGGVLSIVGLALLPFTAGASLGLIIGGTVMGVTSGVNSFVTTATEIGVNRKHQQKASEVFKSFMDDVQVLQDCLEEVSKRETNQIDVAVGVGKVLCKAGAIGKGIDGVVDAASALKLLRSEDVIASAGKVIAQEGKALRNVPRVASDVPDIGQAALKGPLALSKAARGGLIAVNALFIGMDIFFICKDSISLAKGSETEVSQFIRARAALWHSEMDSWQKIHDSLCKGLLTSEENKAILEMLFYPEMKKKKQTEKEMKTPPDEVDENPEKKLKEVSQLIRARAALWRSGTKSWQKIDDSLRKGLQMSEEKKVALERSFYPRKVLNSVWLLVLLVFVSTFLFVFFQ